ncbi:MAG: S-methyl-5-thioribose-1-phosphate isomerase [Phycisphaerae bacterium]
MSESDIKPPVKVLEWIGDEGGFLRLLDQTALPNRTAFLDCRDLPTLWDAIKRLVVRGAPAIGVAGGYGMVLAGQKAIADCGLRTADLVSHGADQAAQAVTAKLQDEFLAGLETGASYVESSRPTAVNLSWAVRRVLAKTKAHLAESGKTEMTEIRNPQSAIRNVLAAMLSEARAIHAEDEAMCLAIGRHAADLIARCRGVLTHCNAGALATAGIGTATAGMYVAHARGGRFTVYCDETRPLLQGARLTAWELMQAGIDAVLITDNMAGQVMREGRVQMVIVGADRIAANGDTANKIGTYGVAVLAKRHNIPFYVAAPYSTFDLSIASGAEIPIEQRGADEITNGFGRRTAPEGVKTYSPAFDVTPAELIAGIITDRGVIQPVTTERVAEIVKGHLSWHAVQVEFSEAVLR